MVQAKGHISGRFELEVLEPRVLLSADVLLVSAVAANAIVHKPVEVAHQESFNGQRAFHDSLQYNPAGETGGIFDGVSGSAVHSHAVVPAQVETHNSDQKAAAVEPAAVQNSAPVAQPKAQVQAQAKVAVLSVATSTATISSSSISAKATSSSSSTTASKLTASLTAANGPPASATTAKTPVNTSVSSNSSAVSNSKAPASPVPNTTPTDLYTLLNTSGETSGTYGSAGSPITLGGILSFTSITLAFTTSGSTTTVVVTATSASINLGGVQASVGAVTATYTVGSSSFSLSLSNVSIALSSFVHIGATSVTLNYVNSQTVKLAASNGVATSSTASVSLLELGLTGGYVFAGVNGASNTSSTAPTLPANAEGLSVTGVSLALALMSTSSGTLYYGLSVTTGTATMVGLPTGFNAAVSNISVAVNGSTDSTGDVVNFDSTFVAGTGLAISGIDLDFQQSLIGASASVSLNFDGYVYISGNLSFQSEPNVTVNLSSGTNAVTTTSSTGATTGSGATTSTTTTTTGDTGVDVSGASGTVTVSLLEVAASNVTVFVGMNGPAGAWTSLPSNAAGVEINNASFVLALMTTTSGTKYYGLQAGVGGNLVPGGATYNSSGQYTLNGLTPDVNYQWTSGAPTGSNTSSDDTSLTSGSTIVNTSGGTFETGAGQTSVTLTGTANTPVTALVEPSAGITTVGLPSGFVISAGTVSVAINGSTDSNNYVVDFGSSFATTTTTSIPTSGASSTTVVASTPFSTGDTSTTVTGTTGTNMTITTVAPGLTVQTSTLAANINFVGSLLSVSGNLTISLGGFVYINGNISFQEGGAGPVGGLNLINGTTQTTATFNSMLEIGASNVTIFAGVNGPSTNSNAVGVELDNAGFGLALISATVGSSNYVFYGLQASAASLGTVGLPSSFNLSATNLAVQVNGGNDGNTVVDFATSFASPGLSVATGGSSSVDLDFATQLIQVSGAINLQFTSYMNIQGGFAFTESAGIININIGVSAYTGASALSVTLGSTSSPFFTASGNLSLTITPSTQVSSTTAATVGTIIGGTTTGGATVTGGDGTLTTTGGTTTVVQTVVTTTGTGSSAVTTAVTTTTVTIGGTTVGGTSAGSNTINGGSTTGGTTTTTVVDDGTTAINNASLTVPSFTISGILQAGTTTVTLQNLIFDNTNGNIITAPDSSFQITSDSATIFPGSTGLTASVTATPGTVGTAPGDVDGLGLNGTFNLGTGAFSLNLEVFNLSVGGAFTATADNVLITYSPAGGSSQQLVSIGSVTTKLTGFGNGDIVGTITNLIIYGNGFQFDSMSLNYTGSLTLGSFLTIKNPTVTLDNFSLTVNNGTPTLSATALSVSVDSVSLTVGAISATATDFTISVSLTGGPVVITAGQLNFNFATYLSVTANTVTINTSPGVGGNYFSIGSATATITAGSLSITGSVSAFAVVDSDSNGDAEFVAGQNFTISLVAPSAGQLLLPSWLGFSITQFQISWLGNNFNTDPGNFQITLSASITSIQGLPGGVTVSGEITDAVINIGMLEAGEFPITSIGSVGGSVSGTLFGMQVNAAFVLGIVQFNAENEIVSGTTVTKLTTNSDGSVTETPVTGGDTTVVNSIMYVGVAGGATIPGVGGVQIYIGFSSLGPLTFYLSAQFPLILDPDTGLAIGGFSGGVIFDYTIPTPGSPQDLATLNLSPASISISQWQQQLRDQTVTQYTSSSGGTNLSAAYSQPFVIEAGVTLYDAYLTADAFTVTGNIAIQINPASPNSTSIFVSGTATFGASVSFNAYLYLNITVSGASSTATVMFLGQAPAATPVETIGGSLQFGFVDSNGNPITPPTVASTIESEWIALNATYNTTGTYSISNVAAGSYVWTPGANDVSLTLGGVTYYAINAVNGIINITDNTAGNATLMGTGTAITGTLVLGSGGNLITGGAAYSTGTYSISNVAAGSYVWTPGANDVSLTVGGVTYYAINAVNGVINITDNTTGNATLMGTGTAITGTLVLGTGGSLIASGSIYSDSVGNTGAAVIGGLVAGSYTWTPGANDTSLTVGNTTYLASSASSGSINFTTTAAATSVLLIGTANTAITGRIESSGSVTGAQYTITTYPPPAQIDGFYLSLDGFAQFSAFGGLTATVSGSVTLTVTSTFAKIDLSGTLNVSTLGNLATATGEIVVDYGGGIGSLNIYGALQLATGSGFAQLQNVGLYVNGAATFIINTTSSAQTIYLPDPNNPHIAADATQFNITDTQSFEVTIAGVGSTASSPTFASLAYKAGGDTLLSMSGSFDLKISSSGFTMFADIESLSVGPSGSPFLTLSGFGLFIINAQGFAAEMDLSLSAQAITGITLNAQFTLVMNTTGANVVYTIPSTLPPVTIPGSSPVSTTRSLTIPAGPPQGALQADGTYGTNVGPAGPYIVITAQGSLSIYSYSFTGFFYFQLSDSSAGPVVALYVNVMGNLGFGTVNVTGGFELSSAGVVVLLQASGQVGAATNYGPGVTLVINAELAINTTNAAISQIGGVALTDTNGNPLTLAAKSAQVVASGTLTMTFGPGSLVINGLFTTSLVVTGSGVTEVDTTTITANGTLTVTVGGTVIFQRTALGVLVFASPGSENPNTIGTSGLGIAGELSLSASGSNPLSGTGFSFSGTFDLEVNTTQESQYVTVPGLSAPVLITAGPNGSSIGSIYAEIHANGTMLFGSNTGTATNPVYNGFALNGDFYLTVGSAGLAVSANVTLGVYVGGASLLSVNAQAAMAITPAGLAASLVVSASITDPDNLYAFGGTLSLQVNTTGVQQIIGTVIIPAAPGGSTSTAGTPYFQIYISGTLALGTNDATVQADSTGMYVSGNFYLTISPAGLSVVANGTLTANINGVPLLTMQASGALIINTSGIAGELTLTVNEGDPLDSSGLYSFSGSFNLQLNTTGNNYYVGSDGTIYSSVPAAGTTYTALTAGPQGATTGGFYFEVEANGTLTFGTAGNGFSLAGNLYISVGSEGLAVSANAAFTANVLNKTLLTMNASGAFIITAGGIAGELTLTFGAGDSNPLNGVGFSFTGGFSLEVNTTGINYYVGSDGSISMTVPTTGTYVTIAAGPNGDTDTPGSSYFEIDANGSLLFGTAAYGFALTGDLFLSVGTTGLAVSTNDTFNVNINSVSVISLTASGAMEITSAGLAASLTLTASSGNSLFSNTSLPFGFNGIFTFQLNTTNKAINDMIGDTPLVLAAGPYFQIYVSGALGLGTSNTSAATGIFLSGTFYLTISSNGLAIAATSNLTAVFDGSTLLTLGAKGGLILTSGGLAGAISLTIGSSNPLSGTGFAFTGTFTLQVNTTGQTYYFWSNGTVSTNAPNITGVSVLTTVSAGPNGSSTGSTYFQIYASGAIVFGTSSNGFTLSGSFFIAIGSTGLSISASVTFTTSVLGASLISVSASGAMEITSAGLAASFTLTVPSLSISSVFTLAGTFTFQINTTNQAIDDNVGGVTLNVPKGPYFQLSVTQASLTFLGSGAGFGLSGSFILTIGSAGMAISATATMSLAGLATFSATGDLLVTSNGIAAKVSLMLTSGFGLNSTSSTGYSFSANFVLEINTTSSAVNTINNHTVSIPRGPFFEILASGTLIMGNVVDITGSFTLTLSGAGVLIQMNASVNVFGVSFTVNGFAAIVSSGIALDITLSVGNSTNPTVTLIPGVLALSGSFELQINTTSSSDLVFGNFTYNFGTTVFKIKVQASLNVFGFSMASTSMTFMVSNTGVFSASGSTTFNFFGFATLNVTFSFDSNGNYSFLGSIYVQLGSSGFNIHGTLSLYFYHNSSGTGFTLSVNGGVTAFDFNFGSIGASVSINNTSVSISVYVSVSFFFFSIGGTVTIHLGSINPVAAPPPPPTGTVISSSTTIDGQTFGAGTLLINVGQYANSNRGVAPQTNENYTITYLSTNSDGSENISVAAVGVNGGTAETYYNIKEIVIPDADIGSSTSNMNVTIAGNVILPVVIFAGSGTNVFRTGNSNATVNGTDGDDTVNAGSGVVTFYAGSGHNTFNGSTGSATITGSNGTDTIIGGTGDVTFYVGSGTSTFTGGGTGSTQNTIVDPGNVIVMENNYSSYILTGASATAATLNYGGNTDILTNTDGGITLSLKGVSSGAQTFTVANYSGNVTFDAAGNTSVTTTVTLATGNMTVNNIGDLANTITESNANSTTGIITLQSTNSSSVAVAYGAVTLNGGTTANTMTINSWSGSGAVTLNGMGGSDSYIINFQSSGSFTANVNGSGTSGGDVMTVNGTASGATLNVSSSAVTLGTQVANYTGIQNLTVNTASNSETVDVSSTSAATTINTGSYTDTVNVGSNAATNNTNGTLNNIVSLLTISGTSSYDTLNLDDTGDTTANTGALTVINGISTLNGVFGVHGSLDYSNIRILNLNLGSGADTLSITATSSITNINASLGTNTIDIGSNEPSANGVVKNIRGALTITGSTTTTVNVDDTGDAAATGTLTGTTIKGLGMVSNGITYSGLSALNISLGNNGNTFTIANTYATTVTTLNSGTGKDTVNLTNDSGITVINGNGGGDTINLATDGGTTTISETAGNNTINVLATGATTNVNTSNGSNTINIGSKAPSANGVVNTILGAIYIVGSGNDTANIGDTGSKNSKTGQLTSTTLTGLGMVAAGITYSGLKTLVISLGSGGNSFNVLSTYSATTTTVNTGTGTNTVTVASTAPSNNAGSILTGIAGSLIITGQGLDTLNVDDTGDTGSGTLTQTVTTLTGLGMGSSGITYTSVETLNINLGAHGNTVYIQGNPLNTTENLNTGTGTNIISIGSAALSSITTNTVTGNATNTGSVLDNVQGIINITGSSTDTLNVDDSGSTNGENGGLWATKLQFLNPGVTINFTGIAAINISLSEAADQFAVSDTFTSASTTPVIVIDGNLGDDTFVIFDTHAVMTINGGDGDDNFYDFGNSAVMNLNGDANDDTFYVYASVNENTTNVGPGAADSNGNQVYSYRVNAAVNIDGGTGNDKVFIFGTVLNDVITITSTSVTGAGIDVNFTNVEQLTVAGLGGDDTFYIESIAIPTTVIGDGTIVLPNVAAFLGALGLGLPNLNGNAPPATSFNDTFYVGWQGANYIPGSLAGIDAALTIDGDNGPGLGGITTNLPGADNTIYVDDSGDTANSNYTLSPTTLTSSAMGVNGSVTYDTAVENFNLYVGQGTNTITVNGNTTATQMSLYGGRGNDTFIVNDTNPLLSPLAIIGGTNTFAGDSLTVNGGLAGNTYDITGYTIDGQGATISYEEIEKLTINAAGATTFNVNGDSVPTYLNGGTGNDTFNVNSNTTSLYLNGGTGNETFVINGNSGALTATATAGTNSFTVNGNGSTLLMNGGSGADSFVINANSGTLTVNGNGGNDTFVVNAISSAATLNGDAGDDTFTVNAPLAAVLTVNGGGDAGDLLIVNGTIGNDYFTITNNAVNGVGSAILYNTVSYLTVNGVAGNDTFLILSDNAATTTTLNGSTGNDLFYLRTTNGPTIVNTGGGINTVDIGANEPYTTGNILDGIQGAVTVNGDAQDVLNIDDSASTTNKNGTLTATTLTGLAMGTGGITYYGIPLFNLKLGSGSDTLNVESTNATTVYNVNLGAGTNIVNIGSLTPTLIGGIVDGVQGTLNLTGSGNDTLNVDDTGSTMAKTGAMTSSTLTGLGMGAGGVTYVGFTTLNISLGSGGNTFTINNTLATTVTTVNSGSGNDTVNLLSDSDTTNINGQAGNDTINIQTTGATTNVNTGAGANTVNVGSLAPGGGGIVNNIQGALNVTGSGTDTLNVDDTGSTTAKTGLLTSSTLTGLGMGTGGITYTGLAILNINLGSGSDTFNIQSTYVSTVNNLNTGAGTNTVNVGSLAPAVGGIVDNIQGTLNVTGDSHDTLNVDDTGSTIAKTGVLTSDTLTGLGMGTGGITYVGLSRLNISLGSGGNTFTINSTYSATVTTLNSGSGNDTVNLLSDADTTNINGQAGNDTINFQTTGATTNVNTGSGTNVVNVGSLAPLVGGIVDGIQGTVNVTGSGTDTLNLDDTGSTAAKTGAMTSSTITGLGMGVGGITYTGLAVLNISLGGGGNTFTINSTFTTTVTTLNSGSGNDTVNLLTDSDTTNINGQAGNDTINIQTTGATTNVNTGSGTNVVNVGSLAPLVGGIVDNIQGTLNVTGSGSDTMNVDDTGSITAKTGVLTSNTLNGLGMGSGGINYTGLATLNISLGSGGNTFTINSTFVTTVTTVNSGSGSDTVNLLADSDTTNINGQAGNDVINIQTTGATTNVNTGSGTNVVNVGSLAPNVGGILNNVQGTLNVTGSGSDTMNVDDTGSTAAKTGAMTSSTITGLGMGSGGINYTGLAVLNISLGSGGNTFTINSTFATTVTTLNSGSGSDTVNLLADSDVTNLNGQAGNDTINIQTTGATTNANTGSGTNVVNIGSLSPVFGGKVNSIQGTVNVTGSGSDILNVDDTGSTASKTGAMTSSTITGLGMGSGGITYTGLATLNLKLGSGSDTFNVQSTYVSTVNNLNTGAGSNTVNVGSLAPAVGGIVDGIQGTLNVTGSGSDMLNVDDTGSTAAKIGAMTSSTITGLGMGVGGITYTGLSNLNISLGSGGNTFTISSTFATTVTRLNSGAGNDTVNLLTDSGITNINGQAGNDTINIQSTGATTNVNTGTGTNTVNIGSLAPVVGGIVDNIQGTVNVSGSGSDTLNVDDTGSTAAKTGTLTANTLTGLGMGAGGITYTGLAALNISLGSGGNTFTISSTSTNAATVTTLNSGSGNDMVNLLADYSITNINTQGGNDVVNVQSTSAPTSVNTGSGTNVVNVGSLAPAVGGNVNGIQGTVNVTGSGTDTLNVDDTGSTAAKTGVMTSSTIAGLGMGAGGIAYTGLAALNITLGSGGNNFTIAGTSSATTRVHSGSGNDTFNIQATTGTLYVNGDGGSNTFNLGSLAPVNGGTLNNLAGAIFLTGGSNVLRLINLSSPGTNIVNLDDSGDTANNTGTLTSSTITGLGMGGGVTFVAVNVMNLKLGSGNDTFNVQNTNASTVTNLNTGSGTDVVNVGSLAPVIGSVVNGIQGTLNVTGNGTDTLNVDDTGSTGAKTGTLTSSTLTGLGLGAGGITYTGLANLNISLGSGGNTFVINSTKAITVTTLNSGSGNDTVNLLTDSGVTNINGQAGNDTINIQSTGATTNVNTGAGTNTVNIGSLAPAVGGMVNNIQGTVNVTGSGSDILNVDDTGSTIAKTGKLTSSALTGLGMGAGGITYTGLAILNLKLGSGSDTFNVQGTSSGTVTNLNTGAGTNTVNVGSLAPNTGGIVNNIQGTLNVTGSGNDTMNVDDTGSTTAKNGLLTATTLTGLGLSVGGITYTGLITLNINLGSGNDTFTITGVTNTTVTTVNGGTGTNTAVMNFSGNFAGNLTLLNFVTASLNVGGNFSGTLTDAGAVTPVTIGGSLTSTGILNAGSIATMTVGVDLAGLLNVTGLLGTLTITGGSPGKIVVGSVDVINVLAGYGNKVLQVITAGIERDITATPVAGGMMPNTVHFMIVYDAQTVSDPQAAIRVTDTSGTVRSYNLALVVVNSSTAKFDLSRLDSTGATGIGNISVQGDLLTKLTAPELAVFTNLTGSSPGGIVLPTDNIIGVEVSGKLPEGFINVAGIEGLAFGALTTANGAAVTVTNLLGSTGGLQPFWNILGSHAALNSATDVLVVPFVVAQPVSVFAHIDGNTDMALVMTLSDQNTNNLPLTAYVQLVPLSGNNSAVAIQSLVYTTSGGSATSPYLIRNTSTLN